MRSDATDVLEQAQHWRGEGLGVALATVVQTWGSSPRPAGSLLAVNDRSELPAAPQVTPKAGDPCGSAAIQSPPAFPILVDNALPHTRAFGAPQTFMVTLPTDVTCTKCTLQVLEFMSSHGAPCFYHHCADISIQGEVGTSTPSPTPTPIRPTAASRPR